MRVSSKALGFLMLASMLIALVVIRGQEKTPTVPKDEQSKQQALDEKLSQLPVADFDSPEPNPSESLAVREIRNSRHNSLTSTEGTKKPVLNEGMEPVVLDLPMSHKPEEPPIPIDVEAIVIGTVGDAKAYVSTDKTSVYSEVGINIEQVLKGDLRYALVPGGKLQAERNGGAVRFRSGKTLRRGALGRNIPSPGHRYLLFLNYNEEGGSFSIVTGYELENNRVLPLDGTTGSGGNMPEFNSYERYRDTDEAALINDVRRAIKRSSSPEGGQP